MSRRGEWSIRFAAGSPRGAHGNVYKLWGLDGSVRPDGSSDVYLADREVGKFLKTSLHESGKWRTAVTEEALASGRAALPAGSDRKMAGWDRPPMHATGLTVAYRIATPSSELRTTRENLSSKAIHWVEDPGPGKAIQFLVVMAAARINAIVLSDPGPLKMRLLDQYRLPNGELVGVVRRTVEMTQDVIDKIRATVGGWTVQSAGGGPMGPMDRVRCTLFVEELDGGEGLIDVAMPCTV